MILDDRAELASALPISTGGAGTYNIGDALDTHGPQIGHAAGMNATRAFSADAFLVIKVSTDFAGASAVAQFRLVSDNSMTPDTATCTVHATSGPLPAASLTAGRVIFCVSCRDLQGVERYLGVQQITSGAAFSAGAVSIFFTDSPSLLRTYADNVL